MYILQEMLVCDGVQELRLLSKSHFGVGNIYLSGRLDCSSISDLQLEIKDIYPYIVCSYVAHGPTQYTPIYGL